MNSKSKYLSSAFLMLVSSVIVKAIGAVYKIPLTSFIGAVGRGYFATAYNLCLPVHAIILGSLPIALSRLVAKYYADDDRVMLMSLKKSAFRIFSLVGIGGMALVMLLSRPYSIMVAGNARGAYTIIVLAPTILFSSLGAVYQSYYQGLMNMRPTSFAQLLDALFKMVLGLVFARASMVYLYNTYLSTGCVLSTHASTDAQALSLIYPLTSAAAMLGATIASFFSYLYVYFYDLIHRDRQISASLLNVKQARGELLNFVFPILVSCAVQSVFQFLDTAAIQYSLKSIDQNTLLNAYSYSNASATDLPTYVYGIFSAALDFKNLITGVTMALGVCAVPAIGRECELQNNSSLSLLINSIYKYTVLLSLLGGSLLAAYSKDILSLFYSSTSPDIVIGADSIVKGFAISIVLYSLAGTAVFTVQAIGCPQKSIVPYAIAGVIRVVLNIVLIKETNLLLMGAVVSGAVGYLAMCVMNIAITVNKTSLKLKIIDVFIKPVVIFVASLYLSRYISAISLFSSVRIINLLIKIALLSLIFCILCFLLKTLKFEEFFLHKKVKKMA